MFKEVFMGASISENLKYRRLFSQTIITIFSLVVFSVAPSAFAQSGHEQIDGVKNFERVTDLYFRGGAVTPDGIKTLAEHGSRKRITGALNCATLTSAAACSSLHYLRPPQTDAHRFFRLINILIIRDLSNRALNQQSPLNRVKRQACQIANPSLYHSSR
jgi:hypothetical protein